MPEKYQNEIEEILKRSEEQAPADTSREVRKPAPRAARKPDSLRMPASREERQRPALSPSTGRWPTITPGKLMLAGLVIFLIAALLRVSFGWVGMGTLIWVSLGILAVAYLMFFIKPAASGYEKRWRGQPLEERRASFWRRFTRWLRS